MRRFAFAAVLLLVSLFCLPAQGTVSALDAALDIPASGTYNKDILIVPGALASGIFFEYQFAGSASWISLDSVLCLAALSGEQRMYTVSFRQKNRPSANQTLRTYVIDKKRPPEPVIQPASDDATEELSITIKSKEVIFYSISPDTGFRQYNPAEPLVFKASAKSAQEIVVSAYCVDAAGNASLPAVSSFRLLPKNFLVSSSFQPVTRSSPVINSIIASSTESPLVFSVLGYYNGFSLLGIQAPKDLDQVFIFIGDSPSSDADDYIRIPLFSGKAGIPVPLPLGYRDELMFFAGVLKNGILRIDSKNYSVSPSSVGSARGFSFDSLDPEIVPLAGNALIYWPHMENTVFYSIQGAPFLEYAKPFCIAASARNITISYYSQDIWGNVSDVKTLDFKIEIPRIPPNFTGIEDSGIYGLPLLIQSSGDGTVRYTLSDAGTAPPVTIDSPLASAGISVQGEKKSLKTYSLRLVSFNEKNEPGPDNLISFSIDRVDPNPPEIVIKTPASFSDALAVELKAPVGLKIQYEVSENPVGLFTEYRTPILLVPNGRARQTFTVRAYAENSFGLRSEYAVVSGLNIDGSAIYLDSEGAKNGNGTPQAPVSSIHEAIKLAELNNVARIYIHGNCLMDQPVIIGRKMEFIGSLDAAWRPSSGEKTTFDFSRISGNAFPYVTVENSRVAFDGVTFLSDNQASKKVLQADSSTVTMSNCEFKVRGGTDVILFSQTGSALALENSTLGFSEILAARCFFSVASATTVTQSRINVDSNTRLFEFYSGNGGSLAVRDSVLEASPQLMFSGFMLTDVDCTLQRSFFRILSGTSTCRFLQASNARVNVNSFFSDIQWKGNIEVFSAQNNSRLVVYHSTFRNSSRGLVFLNAQNSSFAVANSIVDSDSQQAILISANRLDDSSFVLANCIDGFTQLMEGSTNAQTLENLNTVFFKPNTRYYNFPVRNIQENPGKTFLPSAKEFARLSPLSACIDAGMTLFPQYKNTDIDNEAVPSTRGRSLPDIGAEEL